jgi:hypothetical protein
LTAVTGEVQLGRLLLSTAESIRRIMGAMGTGAEEGMWQEVGSAAIAVLLAAGLSVSGRPAHADESAEVTRMIRAGQACIAEVAALRGTPRFTADKLDAFVRNLAMTVDVAEAWLLRGDQSMAARQFSPDRSCDERVAAWVASAGASGMQTPVPAANPAPSVADWRDPMPTPLRIGGWRRPVPALPLAMRMQADREAQERLYELYGRLR